MNPAALSLLVLALAADPAPLQVKPFKITVVDAQTERGVPLVELRTVNHVRLVTDSNGVAAVREPELMGQTVFFHVKSHGYEFPKDGFGFRGKALAVTEGGSAKLTIQRLNVGERLYRVTGAGIYADSLLVGEKAPLRQPLLNAQVFGSDSVLNAVYRGKLFWFWGDTNRPGYPLGNFHVPGATSVLPKDGGLDPDLGVDLNYFVDEKGFAKTTAKMPGDGPTWIVSLVVVRDGARERMFAGYVKVRPPLTIYERGLAEWDDDAAAFKQVATIDMKAPLFPQGHAFLHAVDGVEYVYFAHPYPLTRVRATAESLRHVSDYEGFTCLKEGTRPEDGQIERIDGRVRYSWKKNTPPLTAKDQAKLIQSGALTSVDALTPLRHVDSGKAVTAHAGSVYWNACRRRWVMIATEIFGTSVLGEVWYAEADTPVGPWVYARKVATHEKYDFYNPKQHPEFDKRGGRVIFFEGTYTHTFAGNPDPTPRYDYNQVMYKLDLNDPRLALPVAIYQTPDGRYGTAADLKLKTEQVPGFFALDRKVPDAVAVVAFDTDDGSRGLRLAEPPPGGRGVFYALPADSKNPPKSATPLFEFVHKDGKRRVYSTDAKWAADGFTRAEKPLCLVWPNPTRVALGHE